MVTYLLNKNNCKIYSKSNSLCCLFIKSDYSAKLVMHIIAKDFNGSINDCDEVIEKIFVIAAGLCNIIEK